MTMLEYCILGVWIVIIMYLLFVLIKDMRKLERDMKGVNAEWKQLAKECATLTERLKQFHGSLHETEKAVAKLEEQQKGKE